MPKQRPQSNPRDQKKQDSEFDQKLLDVARVARVTAGGRRFSFRVVVVIGDRAGRVGVGVKKGKDVQMAIEKAVGDAKKNMITVHMTKDGSIPYESYGKSTSAVVFLKPASKGRGIIAGGAVRVVCDLAGYKDIVGKMISRTNNKLNNARATVVALKSISAKDKPLSQENKSKKSTSGKKDKKNSSTKKINADSSTKKTKTKKS